MNDDRYTGPARRPLPAPRVDCPRCGGDGLRSVTQIYHGRPYVDTVACTCAAGAPYRPLLAAATAENDAEIAHLGYRIPTPDRPS